MLQFRSNRGARPLSPFSRGEGQGEEPGVLPRTRKYAMAPNRTRRINSQARSRELAMPLTPTLSPRAGRGSLLGSAFAAFFLLQSSALAQETITKPITIYVAGTAGGGIDLYARLLGRHIGKHIPGNPSVNVQDMPGAGGIRAANFLADSAPKDGTAITTFPGGPLIEPLVGVRNPGYDMSKFNWIGAISRDVSLCISWGPSAFKTFDDAKKQEMVLAGTGAGSETDTYPLLLNDTLDTKFRLITGYLGTKETFMAIEGGEVHGRCGLTLSSLEASKPDWLRDKKVNVILQLGFEKNPKAGYAPLVFDLLKNDADKQLFSLFLTGTAIGRPFATPPGTPPAKVELLRRAFDETMKDPEFLADGKTMQAEISPTSGVDTQALIAKAYATPAAVVDRAKKLVTPAAK
jgi:tripartite-type tricarboxylate transporter receptor subunit TctC